MSAAHDPLCGLDEICEEECPEHSYCHMSHGMYCVGCFQWCICERLAKARADEREKVVAILNGLPRVDIHGDDYHEWPMSDVVRAVRDELDIPDADAGEGINLGGES